MVNSREEAQRAVAYSKYPPIGTLVSAVHLPHTGLASLTILAIGKWQTMKSWSSFRFSRAQALQNLDEILSVPGIDVAFVGPNDLHAQIGLTPSSDGTEPEFLEALERIQASASKYDLALGIFSSNGNTSAERIRQGFQNG